MIVFRKISDVKREEEEMLKRNNEAPLNLPPDHPVRRLFQRFRQQREARLAAERASQGEPPDVEKGIVQLEQTKLRPHRRLCPPGLLAESCFNAPAVQNGNLVGCKSAEPPPKYKKGWGRFKESVVKAESWSSVSKAESMETLPDRTKSHNEMSLKKTDSCDSGITKSDLRLDNVGDARTPQDQSPVQSEGKLVVCPIPVQTMHASFLELKQQLRGDIRSLNGRMAVVEAQLAEMLQLLKSKKTSGSRKASRSSSFFEMSRPASPDSDKDNSFSQS
ncbi:hypothetical protein J4Q44_G00283320 [Coregonus suidteri]|uniref:Potassium voltage-gated channel subfamily H member 1 n=1 Tax=Coregonus suidteri TaxID=861788 RepID=A0AAN8KSK3_9TELE